MHPLLYLMPVVGVGFIFFMNWMAKRVEAQLAASQRWPSVPGTITRSGARVVNSVYYPAIRYDYDVGGQRLSATRYAFGNWSGTYQQVSEVIAGLPEGGQVPVYYDPANPKFAVLERVAQGSFYRWFGWAIGCVLIAVFVLVLVVTP
ncbi:DUF3592 domain-containing protein [Sphingomonas sp. MG17]|uniref:DUF3592 domain-containing protein n=1 Tax=Sphingomonas tagetis TaxID=2949092 RepID=A0A9X2HNQ4_9SPHN|nr:DUF3592 domain-containing protein [Sphingomonas tagetis]MCP3730713.1 DUF3592 domain-containing protein [Sphingomonas tagetis]